MGPGGWDQAGPGGTGRDQAEGGHFMSPQGCWRPPDEGRVGPLIDFVLFLYVFGLFSSPFVFANAPGFFFFCSVLSVCSCCLVLFFQPRISCSFCVISLFVLSYLSARPLLCFCFFCFVFVLVLPCLAFLFVLSHLCPWASHPSARSVSSFCSSLSSF